jgi:hypothetical protein
MPTELATSDPGDLGRQHQSLVRRQARGDVEQPLELDPPRDQLMHFGARVANLDFANATPPDRERILERGLQRTAPTQRPATIANARLEALFERVGDVRVSRKAPPGAHGCEQLEGRLAETVLEVLPAQAMTIRAQQRLTLGVSDERDLLVEVEPHGSARVWSSMRGWGRHAVMSLAPAPRPPSQLRR